MQIDLADDRGFLIHGFCHRSYRPHGPSLPYRIELADHAPGISKNHRVRRYASAEDRISTDHTIPANSQFALVAKYDRTVTDPSTFSDPHAAAFRDALFHNWNGRFLIRMVVIHDQSAIRDYYVSLHMDTVFC